MKAGGGLLTVHKEESPENSDELTFYDTKATPTSSSPKRSGRRGMQKRVVQQLLVPIINKEVEGSRNSKVESTTVNNTPPSDSWAWRKYGQKPIKGSPYPRGYYRCSSSKGCPARKQVERSRTDPTMVMVTYSCEHNHPWPAVSASSRNNHHHHHHHHPPTSPPATEPTTSNTDDQLEEEEEEEDQPPLLIQTTTQMSTEAAPHEHDEDQKFTGSLDVVGGPFVDQIQYGWFSDHDLDSCTSSISTTCMLESPLMGLEESDMTTIFSIREDEESFFADLGELPECTTVFRRRGIERVEDHRRNLATAWCTTG